MNVKILGSGCANCQRLEALTKKVIDELGVEAQIDHVRDYAEIMKYPILSTPALVINEKVVASCRIPSEKEIKGRLNS